MLDLSLVFVYYDSSYDIIVLNFKCWHGRDSYEVHLILDHGMELESSTEVEAI